MELLLCQLLRSITDATNTGPFIELGVTMCPPSGDQLNCGLEVNIVSAASK